MAETTVRDIKVHSNKDRELTRGSIQRAIWSLAPAMMLEMGILNVAQLLDVYWVGRLGSAALAAVTLSATVRWVLNSLANGLGTGGLAVVARRIGAGDREGAGRAAGQTILLALGASLLVGGLGLVLARPVLVLLGADEVVLPLALRYLRVALGGVFTLVVSYAINSLLRGAGEARLSMRVLMLSTATTVVLEPVLILGPGPVPALGVVGSAWAFVLGYGAGLVLQGILLLRGQAGIPLRASHLRPDLALMRRIVGIALPSAVQMTLRSSSRLAVLALVGLYGTEATAGYGVANRLLLLALIPCFGLGNAAGTLVGQNLGAGQPERGRRSAWWVSAYASGYVALAAAVLTLLAPELIALFDATPEVVTLGAECLRVVAVFEVASAVGVVLGRGLDGAGHTIPGLGINLLSLWGIEVAAALVLSRWLGLGLVGVWWGRALANLANGLLFGLWFQRGRWMQWRV